jgi:thymidylate kinase
LQGIFTLTEELYGDPHDDHPQIPATLREFTIANDLLAWSRDTLLPLLDKRSPVVWDRSPLWYETYALCYDADLTWPRQLLSLVEQPDLVVLLDLDPTVAVDRVRARVAQPHQTDEGIELLSRVRNTYLSLAAHREDVVVVDAHRPADDVAAAIWQQVSARLTV